MIDSKRTHGRYFTVSNNPFKLPGFVEWATRIGLPKRKVLEPFAGANHIVRSLQELDLCYDFQSYDINPSCNEVKLRDTIQSFPKGFDVCITNPPWLAKNSATRRRLPYPTCQYDDLYKHCLELCLNNCQFVAAVIPASYLQSGLFQERLQTFILLHDIIFKETENPVCLALFGNEPCEDTDIYYDERYIGRLTELSLKIPRPITKRNIRFNDPKGELGFISFDNTRCRSIRFCSADEIDDYEIKASSRFITRIGGEFEEVTSLIPKLNQRIDRFRDETYDLFLTPFKGIREDGEYRRRMFFSQARQFIDMT